MPTDRIRQQLATWDSETGAWLVERAEDEQIISVEVKPTGAGAIWVWVVARASS